MKSLVKIVGAAAIDIDGTRRALIRRNQRCGLLRTAQWNDRVANERHFAGIWINAVDPGPVKPVPIKCENVVKSAEMQESPCDIVGGENQIASEPLLNAGGDVNRGGRGVVRVEDAVALLDY